jgi:hypothetical protein
LALRRGSLRAAISSFVAAGAESKSALDSNARPRKNPTKFKTQKAKQSAFLLLSHRRQALRLAGSKLSCFVALPPLSTRLENAPSLPRAKAPRAPDSTTP